MAMARTIPATFALPLLSSVDESKDGTVNMLLFTHYCFVDHFKSTTSYIVIHFPIFHHYHPLEADTPLFIHNKNICGKIIFVVIIVSIMFKKEVKK